MANKTGAGCLWQLTTGLAGCGNGRLKVGEILDGPASFYCAGRTAIEGTGPGTASASGMAPALLRPAMLPWHLAAALWYSTDDPTAAALLPPPPWPPRVRRCTTCTTVASSRTPPVPSCALCAAACGTTQTMTRTRAPRGPACPRQRAWRCRAVRAAKWRRSTSLSHMTTTKVSVPLPGR